MNLFCFRFIATFILFNYNSVTVNKLLKLWKSIHKGPVRRLALTNTNFLMASGGSDSTVRLWDLVHHVCTHNLKGIQGVVRYVFNLK